jgi:hypothetical protein
MRRFVVAAASGLALLFAGFAGNAVHWGTAGLLEQPSLWVSVGLALSAAVVEVFAPRSAGSTVMSQEPDNLISAARGRGAWSPGERGYWFQGRVVALEEINAWLVSPRAQNMLIVTGEAGSGKSAILGRVWTTADRQLRAQHPREDLGVKTPVGSISAVVDARGLTTDEIAGVIATAARSEPPRTASHLSVVLERALRHRRKPFVVLMDSLDEAASPVDARRLVQELAGMGPAYGVRVLLGTRKRWRHEPLVERFDGAQIIDLDPDESGSSKYFKREDLELYTLTRLQQDRVDNPYLDNAVAAPVARKISDGARTNFLVAGLTAYAHGRHDNEPVELSTMSVPNNLREALDQYLERVPPLAGMRSGLAVELRPKDALRPLAYAVPPGMPVRVWRVALHGLTGVLAGDRGLEEFARESAVDYLVESPVAAEAPGEGPVYRLFHQALNDTIIGAPADDPRVVREQGMITDALLSFEMGH